MAFRPATKIKNRIAWGLQLNSSKKDKEKTAASMDRIKRRCRLLLEMHCNLPWISVIIKTQSLYNMYFRTLEHVYRIT